MNAKTLITSYGLVWAVVLSVAVSGCATRKGPQAKTLPASTGSPPLQYASSLKPIHLEGKEIQTFTITERPPLTARESAELAEKIFDYAKTKMVLQGPVSNDTSGLVFYQNASDASASLIVNPKTRDISFNKGLKPYGGDNDTANLPSDEEAARLAVAHLEKLSLLPERNEFVPAHLGGLMLGTHSSNGSNGIYKKLVTIRFERRLAGLPVMGRSRLVVHLAENGDLEGLVHRWAPVGAKRVAPKELLPDSDIQKSLEQRLRHEAREARQIIITKTDLVLYDHGGGVIEPAIHVVASLHYEGKVTAGRTVGEIRRLDVPYDSFEPVLKAHYAVYPFMHDPAAQRLIQQDKKQGDHSIVPELKQDASR